VVTRRAGEAQGRYYRPCMAGTTGHMLAGTSSWLATRGKGQGLRYLGRSLHPGPGRSLHPWYRSRYRSHVLVPWILSTNLRLFPVPWPVPPVGVPPAREIAQSEPSLFICVAVTYLSLFA
jgi:hypothetical protein